MSRLPLLCLIILGCQPTCPTQAPQAMPMPGDSGEICVMACQRAAACGCGFAQIQDRCVAACQRDQAQGTASQLDPICLANAQSCQQVAACAGGCKP